MEPEGRSPIEPDIQSGIQWGIGCLVGGAALVGGLILVLLVSIAAQPPVWLQVVLGVAMVGGALCLTWLFTSALRRTQQIRSPRRPRPVGDQSSEPGEPQRPSNG